MANQYTRPKCLQFESTETSEFGRQTAMLMELEPDAWTFHHSFRAFRHPKLGGFEFDNDDRLQHMGAGSFVQGSMTPPGLQRALTKGDHDHIVGAMTALLTRALNLDTPRPESPAATTGVSASQQQKANQLLSQQLATPAIAATQQDRLDAYRYAMDSGLVPRPKFDDIFKNKG